MSTNDTPTVIRSRENPLVKDLRKLATDNTAYRRLGRVWVEGEHLCSAALQRGQVPVLAVYPESHGPQGHNFRGVDAVKTAVLADALWRDISTLESPASMGFVLQLPTAQAIQPDAPSVVLDRVQDAGNVGSILRSAAAFGFAQVLALKGTAALWSPKVLRAGMGAHFGLHLIEGLEQDELQTLHVPLVVTSSHQGELIERLSLPWPCAWVLGHEGQGVCAALQARAQWHARIGQPGGEESLNVAAAAAICLHATAVAAQRG